MEYLNKLSRREVNCILTAVHRLNGFFGDNTEMCSHVHVKDTSTKHNSDDTSLGELTLQNVWYKDLVGFLSDIRNETYKLQEFRNKTSDVGHTDFFLYCGSILMDFHITDECSEYMTLALKLKLRSYQFLRGYDFTDPPTTVIKTIMEFLDYIAFHKLRYELLIACFDIYTLYYTLAYEDDQLQTKLTKVLDAAHRLRFNLFNCRIQSSRNELFYLQRRKYVELSVFQNVKRFLVFAMYGYEDVCCRDADAIDECMNMSIEFIDFCSENDVDEHFKISDQCYRPLQVLALYAQAINEEGNDEELCAKTLYVLWESIVDPYMTEEYFWSSFVRTQHYPVYSEAWKWYSRIVLGDAKPDVSSPRSLKHLARITIRRRLTECVQLPFGVEFLNLPQILKKYVRLE